MSVLYLLQHVVDFSVVWKETEHWVLLHCCVTK